MVFEYLLHYFFFLFIRETLYDDSDDAVYGVSFSSGFLGLAALMLLCPSPYAFLITIAQCQEIKLLGLLLNGLPF